MTIFNTGGTFNKRYDPVKGELFVPSDDRAVETILQTMCAPVHLHGLIYKDSLEMDDADRETLGEAVRSVGDSSVVVVHGTDTMDLSAAHLASLELEKVIVLTGAMVPFSIDPVEATANLAMAMGLAQANERRGVYICMQGIFAPFEQIRKNREEGTFERVDG